MGESIIKKASKLLKFQKTKLFVFLFLFLIILLFFHKLFIYTPPLLDSGKRDILENTIDFFSFAWHLTEASLLKDYLNKPGESNGSFVKAGWHRKRYLLSKFWINEDELVVFLNKNKDLPVKTIKNNLYTFLFIEKEH